jgi:hypothetical protein
MNVSERYDHSSLLVVEWAVLIMCVFGHLFYVLRKKKNWIVYG